MIKYETIHPGSTVLYEDESFGFAYYNFQEPINLFAQHVTSLIEELKKNKTFDPSANREDLIYFSSLPWLTFTSFKHAQDSAINKSIPRITFGKYFEHNGRFLMPINVEVNHAIMDGYHVGQFYNNLEHIISNIK